MRYEDLDFRKDDKVSIREEKLPEAGKMFLYCQTLGIDTILTTTTKLPARKMAENVLLSAR